MAVALDEIHDDTNFSWNVGAADMDRVYLYSGLPVPAPTGPTDNFGLALNAGLPVFASQHPTLRNMYVSGYSMRPFPEAAKGSYKIRVHHAVPSSNHPLGGVMVEMSGSNGQFTLNRWPYGDQQGQPILVGCNFQALIGRPAQGKFVFEPQINPASVVADANNTESPVKYDTVEIPIESPAAILKFTRTEYKTVTQNFSYRKTLNSNTWLGFSPRTVFLRDVNVCKIFGVGAIPDHYVVSYMFEIYPSSDYWERVEFFKDIHSGKPVVGCDLGDGTYNGYTKVFPYPFTDFNKLKFPNI